MATSCEDSKWFWVYFTSVNDIAKCDICYTSFQIIEVQKDNLMRHIEIDHCADYQRIVLSKGSQKDFESQLYIIHNKDITCKFCNLTYYAMNNLNSLIHHLKKTHTITQNKAANICEKLRNYYFDAFDTDMKRNCTSCNDTILNKPLHLMSHLSKVHKVDLHLKIGSMGFLTCSKWVWEYFSRSEEREAKCSVCNHPFFLARSYSYIIQHIEREHGNNFDVSENSQGNKKWFYSITENNKIKCDICDTNYDIVYCSTAYMKTHLIQIHNLNEDIARKLCDWVLEYFHLSKFQTSKCNICENMFQTSNCFNLMIHLIEAHQVRVSPEIIPPRLSNEISSLFNFDRHAQDIVISSKSQQPTCSFDQNSYCDNFLDQIDKSSEIRTRHAQDIVTSSKSQQPTCSVDQNSYCDFFLDQIDKSSEIRTTSLSNSERHAQDIVTSSKSQQPTCNFDQNSDCDNFFDQIDESSEIRTTRLLSSSSRLLNYNNNTEDITASSSYQQPTYNTY